MCSCVQLMIRPVAQRFLHDGRAVNGQVDAEDQAFAANFADEVEARGEGLQTFAQFRAAFANIREKIFVFDDVKNSSAAAQIKRAAAERGAVHSRGEGRGEFFVGDERAERQAARERLGDGDDIRRARRISGKRNVGRCGRGRTGFRRR